jgi:hypothetical protein
MAVGRERYTPDVGASRGNSAAELELDKRGVRDAPALGSL